MPKAIVIEDEQLEHAVRVAKVSSPESGRRDAALLVTCFCKRISVPRKTFDKWLAPEGSKESRAMPEMAWSYVRDILNNSGK